MKSFRILLTTYLLRVPGAARLYAAVRATPRHIVHWYVLLFVTLLLIFSGAVVGMLSFLHVRLEASEAQTQVRKKTIVNESEIQTALDDFRARNTAFTKQKGNRERLPDPGR